MLRFLLSLLLLASLVMAQMDKVEQAVQTQLEQAGKAEVFVIFEKLDMNERVKGMSFENRGERVQYVNDSLKKHANECQASAKQFLDEHTDHFHSYNTFKVNNSLFVKDASKWLVEQLSLRPEVRSIAENKQVSVM
eukprot:Rmarinus@m.10256